MPAVKKSNTPLKKVVIPATGKKVRELTAKKFIEKLFSYRSAAELKKYDRYFPLPRNGDEFVGVRMGQVFEVAKAFMDMKPSEIEKLMEHKIHEVRAGALSIMGKKGSHKKTTPEELKELYQLYLRRHDRINNWDLVDLAAHQVVGRYLADKPRSILYKLVKSRNVWERRTAIVSTAHFILKRKDTEDAFLISEMLLNDDQEFIHTAVGWMLRAAGGVDRQKLINFLDRYADTMPRVALRASLEHFDQKTREYYLGLKVKTKNN